MRPNWPKLASLTQKNLVHSKVFSSVLESLLPKDYPFSEHFVGVPVFSGSFWIAI